MKTKLFLTSLILSMVTLSSVGVGASLTKADLKRGKLLSSKYICSENFKIGNECETSLDNGEKTFKRDIRIQKKFKKIGNNKDFEHRGELGLNIVFEYDKNGHVKSSNIEQSKNSDYWKIKNLAQVYPDNDHCLVSNRYCAYKKNAFGTVGDHVLDGHIDVICSDNGSLFINTELD